jgi:hypothetical protein
MMLHDSLMMPRAAIFDTASVPDHLKLYIPLFCNVLAGMGAGGLDYKYAVPVMYHAFGSVVMHGCRKSGAGDGAGQYGGP